MKKNRIVIILALAATFLCSAGAFAQRHGGHGRGVDLNLTPEQKTQIQAIHQQQRAKMQDLSKQSLTREQFRTQAMAIHRSGGEQVNSVLTPGQRAKQAAARGKRHGQNRRRGSQTL